MDVRRAALAVLATAEPAAKAAAARDAAARWRAGELDRPGPASVEVPDRPARPARPELLPPGRVPRRRLGSASGRAALLHAVAHIEFNAIDLAFDMVARFGAAADVADAAPDFVGDWIAVGDDEARHFVMVNERLTDLGAAYGDLPAHDGLWEAAAATADDVLARLAVAPLVLEARGLDVTPDMIRRLRAAGDDASADVLGVIYREEIGHVAAGRRWFEHVCAARGAEPAATFQALVRSRFRGELKAPFNEEARDAAGFAREFYAPLAASPR
jgi:uncharacterized ferritin-like protein (DUF455 family)